jgi:hypothetical protein
MHTITCVRSSNNAAGHAYRRQHSGSDLLVADEFIVSGSGKGSSSSSNNLINGQGCNKSNHMLLVKFNQLQVRP